MLKKFDSTQAATIAQRFASGESANSLAKRHGTSVGTILRIVRNAGLSVQYRKVTPALRQEIADSYAASENSISISRRLGIAKTTVLACLREQGIDRRPMWEAKRIHTLDETVFDNPGPEGRYWVGFLMADGCIHKKTNNSPEIKLGLAWEDIAHVEAFRTFCKSTHSISSDSRSIYNRICGYETVKNGRAEISFTSTKIAAGLARFGVVPRKTRSATVSLLESDPDFWRGVVDGDGCIGFHRPGFPYIFLCGSRQLMEQFSRFIQSIVPECKAAVRQQDENVFVCRTTGKKARAIIRVLYHNAAVSLPRKAMIASQILTGASQLNTGTSDEQSPVTSSP